MNAEARMSPGRGPQHMQALERANAVRLARAELKRRVAIGEITAADVILGAPWEAESMTVSDLLTSQRRWGHTRSRKFLAVHPHVGEQDRRLDDRSPASCARADAGSERYITAPRLSAWRV